MPMERLLFVGIVITLLSVANAQPNGTDTCNQFPDCGTCVSDGNTRNTTLEQRFSCLWCGSESTCKTFRATSVIPLQGVPCPGYKYNVGTCTINALTVVIIIAVVCFLFMVLVCFVCCCCCIWCARRRKRRQIVEENRYLDEKENIRQRSAERRAERKAKHDEIRRKYGLSNDDQSAGSYKKLES